MKVRSRVMLLLASMSLLAPAPSLAQVVKRTGDGFLTTLKTGQWIRLEGTVQKDQTIRCNEVRLLTGDFLDNEWSIRGAIRSLDRERREMTIGRYSILVNENAVFENSEGSFNEYSDLRPGMVVEVEGTYRRDGTFAADEVDDESDEVEKKRDIERRIRVVARVERVDPSRRRITAMGTVFQVTSQTQVKSVLR